MSDAPPGPVGARRSDLLTGSLRKTVFLLALPVLLEQFLSFCVGFYDTLLSVRLSSDATTAIGLGAYVGWLASMMFGMVGTGTAALVSRHWGAGEFEQANRVTNRSITLAVLMGAAVYLVIFVAAPGLAWLLDMPPETAHVVVRYLRIDGLGYLFSSLTLIGAAAFRGVGDMRTPMFVLGLMNVLNIVVSTVLVFGIGPFPAWGWDRPLIPPLGIDGIVLGTLVARVVSGLLMVAALNRGISGLRLVKEELTLRGQTVRRILSIGLPAAADGAIMWGGQLLFLMIIANLAEGRMDSAIFAAHIVGIRVEAITYLPAVAWGYACATMIGQSLGAGNPQRARRVGHEAVLQCSLLALCIAVLFFAGANGIYEFMHEDPAVREAGIPAFRLLAFFQVPLVISIIYVFALRGAGDTRSPMLITILGVLGVRLPMGYLFGIVLEGGLLGAWIGMCADMAVRAVLVTIRYLHGGWLGTQV